LFPKISTPVENTVEKEALLSGFGLKTLFWALFLEAKVSEGFIFRDFAVSQM